MLCTSGGLDVLNTIVKILRKKEKNNSQIDKYTSQR